MKIFKSKKFIISLAVIVLIIVGIVGGQVKAHAKENLEAYQKYCTSECSLTKVSNDQLDETIKLREEETKTNISKSKKSIESLTKYLNDHDLNDEEQKSLDAIKLKEEYSEDSDYTVDQLIEMESNYKSVAKELSNLKESYRTRYLTSKIVSNNKAIKKSKESLKEYDLDETETKTKKAIDKKLTYDTEKKYTVDELSDLNKVYKQAKEDYETLLSDTIKRTTADEEKAEQQAIIDNAGVDYDTTLPDEAYLNDSSSSDYDTSTDTSTTTNSGSTSSNSSASASNSNGSSGSNPSNSADACYDSQGRFNSDCLNGDTYQDNSNSSGGRVCEFQSESDAWAFGEANAGMPGYSNGYGVYPCAEGTWEIYWK